MRLTLDGDTEYIAKHHRGEDGVEILIALYPRSLSPTCTCMVQKLSDFVLEISSARPLEVSSAIAIHPGSHNTPSRVNILPIYRYRVVYHSHCHPRSYNTVEARIEGGR